MVGKQQAELYGGRVGLIHNTLGDKLLDMADVVITVGYVSSSRWWAGGGGVLGGGVLGNRGGGGGKRLGKLLDTADVALWAACLLSSPAGPCGV